MRRPSILSRFSTKPFATPPRGRRIPPRAVLLLAAGLAASLPGAAAATVTTSCIPCRYIARKMNELEAQQKKAEQQIPKLEKRYKDAAACNEEEYRRYSRASGEVDDLVWDGEHKRDRTHFDAKTQRKIDILTKTAKVALNHFFRCKEEMQATKTRLESLHDLVARLESQRSSLQIDLTRCEKRYCPPAGPRSTTYVPPRSAAEWGGLGSGIAQVRNASTDCPPCHPIAARINTSITVLEGTYEQLAESEKQLDPLWLLMQEATQRAVRASNRIHTLERLPTDNPGRKSLDKLKARRDQARKDADAALAQHKALRSQVQALRNQAQQLINSILADQAALAKCEKQCRPASTKGRKTAALGPGAGTIRRASVPLGGSLSGVVVATRRNEKGHDRLLLATPPTRKGAAIDELRVTLPRRAAHAAKAVKLPAGWSMTRHGRQLILSGPALTGGEPVKAQIDLGGEKAPEKVPIDVLSGGNVVEHSDCPVTPLPPAGGASDTSTGDESSVAMPPAVAAGQTIAFSLLDVHRVPEWVTAIVSDGTTPVVADSVPGGAYRYTVPEEWVVGNRIEVSFTDPWGGTLLKVGGGSKVVPPPETTPAAPAISGASPQLIAGQSFCVCGWFPDDASRLGVSLSGVPLGSPASASPEVLTFTAPADAATGAGEVTGDTAAGFGAGDRTAVEVLSVGGSIDREKLKRGESTPVTLWVEGTDRPVSLKLTNHTPGIVSLEGGETQIVVTSGGAQNRVSRTLRAVSPGDFFLDYSLADADCPCAEGNQPRDIAPDAGSASSQQPGG
jgi:polyhydroxyalkanoate synthesis regulator phasin